MKAVVYAGTRNLYPGMVSALKSLFTNSTVDKAYLVIEDDEFPWELPDYVETINASNQTWFHEDGPNFDKPWTVFGLLFAAYPYLFPNLDRILSMDVDTIVQHDIADLWDIPLDGYYFSATPEWHKTKPDFLSTNIGVCMLNLEKLRDGKADEIIHALDTTYFTFITQDAMNKYCQGGILPMSGEYNANTWTEHSDDPKVIHYAGYTNWMDKPLPRKYRGMDWPTRI